MEKDYDVVIVGNGILSYSTAFALMRESADVRIAIVGPADKSGSASMAAGAMLASFAEMEKGALDSAPAKAKFAMSRQSAKMWPDWVTEINAALGENKLSIRPGTHVIHNTRADDLDDDSFQAIIDTLRDYSEPFEECDPRSIHGLHPDTESRAVRAIYIPGEGSLPSGILAQAFEGIFQKNKNVVIHDDLVDSVKASGSLKHVLTRGGKTISGKKILIAAGARSQDIIAGIPELRGKIPRLFYGVGTAVVLKTDGHAPLHALRTVNRGLACGVHVVPYDKDICYIGASNFISPVPEYSPRMTSLYSLLQAAMEQVHRRFYKAQVLKFVVGHRPTTLDTFPLIGKTSVDGVWILSGTKRDGIHTSPLLAQSLAREMNGKAGLFENPFKPERKPIHFMTKEEGIAKATRHLKSAGVQHELQLPKAGWDDLIDGMLRAKVEEIYTRCGITDFGIPPEMLDMYKYGHAEEQTEDKK